MIFRQFVHVATCLERKISYTVSGSVLLKMLFTFGQIQFSHSNSNHLGGEGGGTLNVKVIGMLVGNFFLENTKKYPDFDFKPLKIPILQFWGLF